MDTFFWASSISEFIWEVVLFVGLTILGLIYGSWLQKRGERKGLRKFPGLFKAFRDIGIRATLKDTDDARATMKPDDFDIVEGTWQFIEFHESNIDFAYFYSEEHLGGVYLHWVVRTAGDRCLRDIKVTFLDERYNSRLWFAVLADVVWEGDDDLAARLNSDRPLRAKLLNATADEALSNVIISLRSKPDHYDIRTDFISPTREAFDALNAIAGHLRAL